jgi:hypothetical protein
MSIMFRLMVTTLQKRALELHPGLLDDMQEDAAEEHGTNLGVEKVSNRARSRHCRTVSINVRACLQGPKFLE